MSIKKDIEIIETTLHNAGVANEEIEMITKGQLKKYVESAHVNEKGEAYKIFKAKDNSPKAGKWYTRHPLNKKNKLWANSELELLHRLAEIYDIDVEDTPTLETLFTQCIEWKAEYSNLSAKTLKIRKGEWNTYYANEPIVKKDITTLKPSDYLALFENWTKDGNMTLKAFNGVKSIISYCYDYANRKLDMGIHNPVRDMRTSDLNFKYEPRGEIKTKALTVEQLKLFREYCEKYPEDILYLMMRLSFYIGFRWEELAAIRPIDIDFDNMIIRMSGSINAEGERVQWAKRKAPTGLRSVPLIPEAADLLHKILELSNVSASETIIPAGKYQAKYTSYERKYKKACNAAGIIDTTNYTSHTSRTTFASMLGRDSTNVKVLQSLMGHTTDTMTRNYVHNLATQEATREIMNSTLR